MAIRKHSQDWMIERVKEYLNGAGSIRSIAYDNGIGHETLRRWILAYNARGVEAFYRGSGNNHYSSEFKARCVKIVLSGELSISDCVAHYGISNHSVLWHWISEYNANKELKDYDPHGEVFMAGTGRKITIEERREIVKFCLEHGRDYKGTASIYNVSYHQVYEWVRKYDAKGEDALADRRGHHKSDDEVDELERLRRENQRLKRQLEEKDMLVELLKKVKEFERM